MNRSTEFLRVWWFPALLLVMVIGNAIALPGYLQRDPWAVYAISVRQDDSLLETTRPLRRRWDGILAQYFAVQEALGGAELVAPARLELDAGTWRSLARVALQEGFTIPVEPDQERLLRLASKRRLLLGKTPLHLVGDLHPPWNAPLVLLSASASESLYVVSRDRYERLTAARP